MNTLHLVLAVALIAFAHAQGPSPKQAPELSAYCVLIHPSSSSNISGNQDVVVGFYEPAPSSFGLTFQNVDVWFVYPNGTGAMVLGLDNTDCLAPIGPAYKNVTVDQPGVYLVNYVISFSNAEPGNSSLNAANLTSSDCDQTSANIGTITVNFTATANPTNASQSRGGVPEVTETRTFSVPIETSGASSARITHATGMFGFAGMALALFISG